MKFGMIKAAACTPSIIVGDPSSNADRIIELIKKAAADGAELAVFPELCVTGYTCGDLFSQPLLIESAKEALKTIIRETAQLKMAAAVGLPFYYDHKLYNCAAVFSAGELLGIVPKKEIPNYGASNEMRHFTPAPKSVGAVRFGTEMVPFGRKVVFSCREMPLFRLGVEIGEDLWVPQPPSTELVAAGATIIANLSASDELVGRDTNRRSTVSGHSARLRCGYIYANAGEGESTTDLVFSGHNLIAENGNLISESLPFDGGYCLSEIDLETCINERRRMNTFPPLENADFQPVLFSLPPSETRLTRIIPKNPFVPDDPQKRKERCERILEIQSAGLQKRIEHVHTKTLLIGVSGGLDSTLALLVCVRAMQRLGRPMTDIVAVTMPGFGTTRRTKTNAVRLCEALGVTLREINITRTVKSHFRDLGHNPDQHDLLFENAQARERTQVLMDLSHQYNGFVVGTGDLSELALGWATYNGDHMSMYGVNASVPKTLVRHLVRYYAETSDNRQIQKTLRDILATPVSPELLPAEKGQISQLTESIIGPYELHDFFLFYLIRRGFSPEKVAFLAEHAFEELYDAHAINKWLKIFLRRFFNNQFKRSCLPDGPKIGTVSLSPRGSWQMPSDASAAAWLETL